MKPLRIGIDARELLGDRTGVGRYLGELLRRWTARADAGRRRFLLYAPEPLRAAELPESTFEQRTIGRGGGTWWEQTWLRRAVAADRPDVFFAPAYTAPLAIGVPLAVTIHDVSFAAHPEWFTFREGLRRRWLTRRAAQRARVIFTDSEFSRREIEAHLGVERARIQVISPGIGATIRAQAAEPRPHGSDLDRRGPGPEVRAQDKRGTAPVSAAVRTHTGPPPTVLYVGSIFYRRRLPDLIGAFARATADIPAARLVIVGDDRSWPPQDLHSVAASYGVEHKVQLLSYIPDAALAELYANAAVFAFLSEYEGFGLTPLEALAAGVPIVVLDTPVAREVYGDAAEYVQRDDLTGTAAALRRFLTSREHAAAQLARAPAIVGRYCWNTTADRTLEHIERIAGR